MESPSKKLSLALCLGFAILLYYGFQGYQKRQEQIAEERKRDAKVKKERQLRADFFEGLAGENTEFDISVTPSGCLFKSVSGTVASITPSDSSESYPKNGNVLLEEEHEWKKLYVKIATITNFMVIFEARCDLSDDTPSLFTDYNVYRRKDTRSGTTIAWNILSGDEVASISFDNGSLHITKKEIADEEITEPNPHYGEKKVTKSLLEEECGYGDTPNPSEECDWDNYRCQEGAAEVSACHGRVEQKYESETITHEETRTYRIEKSYELNASDDSVTTRITHSDSTILKSVR